MKKGWGKILITGVILLSLIIFLAGCTSNNSLPTTEANETAAAAVTTKFTPQQKSFLSSYSHLTVNWNTNEDIPYSLRGFNEPVNGDIATAALNFLDEIKPVFKMNDPASEMSLRTVSYTHLTLPTILLV